MSVLSPLLSRLSVLTLAFVFVHPCFGAPDSASTEPRGTGPSAITQRSSTPATLKPFFDPTSISSIVDKFYSLNNFAPLWVTKTGPGIRGTIILNTLADAWQDGLNPEDYLVDDILRLWNRPEYSAKARLDLLLTTGLARYLADSLTGRINPCLLAPDLFAAARNKEINLLDTLRQAALHEDLGAFLASIPPDHDEYKLLRRALHRYRTIELAGGWQPIPEGPAIKPGNADQRLPLIVKRLKISDHLPATTPLTTTYSEEIVQAVQQFQQRFNLETDGVIGRLTIDAMNIPAKELIKKILINMERWRWLPDTFEGRHILVNIAGFKLTAIDDQRQVLRMPVIVGKVYHKTPVFSGTMRYLVFNPFWNIPLSIAANEIVPSQIDNPDYLTKNNIKIFKGWESNTDPIDPATIDWANLGRKINRYRLRQEPGKDNPLGNIKFIFPNRYDVYLHDTPSQNLFDRSNRAFSHGCIRVSAPKELASFVLEGNNRPVTRNDIQAHIDSGRRKIVVLDTPVPIHILYRTVYVDPDSEAVTFFADLYGRDNLLMSSLFTSDNKSICLYPSQ